MAAELTVWELLSVALRWAGVVAEGDTVVVGGLTDGKPAEGFLGDWVPLRGITVSLGIPGDQSRRRPS